MSVPKLIFFVSIYLFLTPIFVHGQKGNDKAKAIELFKATSSLFSKLLLYRGSNQDSALIINKELIVKFEEVYKTDTANSYVGSYLMNCYKIEGNFREAIKWAKNQFLHDKNPLFIPDYTSEIASYYILLGDFDSSKLYIVKTIELQKENFQHFKDSSLFYRIRDFVEGIKSIADTIYIRPDADLVKQLQLKGNSPCKYSIEILNYIQPFAQIYFDKMLLSKTKEEIIRMQKDCK